MNIDNKQAEKQFAIHGVTCCLFFVIIFKIFIKKYCFCKYIDYLYKEFKTYNYVKSFFKHR